MMARLRLNRPLTPLETVEQARDALAAAPDPQEEQLHAASLANWFVGDAAAVRASLEAFAAQHGVDEIMISPVAGAYAAEDPSIAPGRTQTLELLAG